jgi:hypothetical protein
LANLIWLAEKGDNPDFRGDGTYPDGIWHGLWFTAGLYKLESS